MSGIYGLEIRYKPEWAVIHRQPQPITLQDYFLSFLTSEPVVTHIKLYTIIIITSITHRLDHSAWIYYTRLCVHKKHCIKMQFCGMEAILPQESVIILVTEMSLLC